MIARLGCLYGQSQPKAGSLQDKVGTAWLRDNSTRSGGCQILGLTGHSSRGRACSTRGQRLGSTCSQLGTAPRQSKHPEAAITQVKTHAPNPSCRLLRRKGSLVPSNESRIQDPQKSHRNLPGAVAIGGNPHQ